MNFARFFVTAVVVLNSLISIGCGDKKKRSKADPVQISALRNEGKAKWDETETLGTELKTAYQIMILDQPHRTPGGAMVNSKLMGQKYNWHRLTLAERTLAKEKLQKYVTAISRILEIDAKKGVYVTKMATIRSRYDGALAFQNSLFNFERLLGEQYETKTPGQPPVYFSPVDI